MSEEIGKHKGAVETLLHEKKELSRLLQIVNSQLKRHLGALEDAGIDTDEFINDIQQGEEKQQQRRRSQENKRRGRNNSGGLSGTPSSKKEEDERTPSSKKEEDEEEDAEDLLEGGNDFSDRDFSPR